MVCLIVAAALAADVIAEPIHDVVGPRAVVYAYPLAPLGFAAHGLISSETGFVIPVGASVRFSERFGLDVEAAAGEISPVPGPSYLQPPSGWLFSFGIGPSVQPFGGETFHGLFVASRLRVQIFQPVNGCGTFFAQCVVIDEPGPFSPPESSGVATAFLAEVDVGWHLRFGRFYFAPEVGIGGGYAFGAPDRTGTGLLLPFGFATNARSFVWSLNLNLARVGATLGKM